MSRSHVGPPHFKTAVQAILNNWTALQLGVSQGAGGIQSSPFAAWLCEGLHQWFCENKNLESYEIADFLETTLDQNLNLLVEDGSTDEVSNMLCEFFVICSTKTEPEIIEKLKCLPRCDLSKCQILRNEDEEVADDSTDCDHISVQNGLNEMDISEGSVKKSEKPKNYTDEDGWTVINRKKN